MGDAAAATSAVYGHQRNAVLGRGVDVVYRRSNRAVFEQIRGTGLLLSSTCPTHAPPRGGSLPGKDRPAQPSPFRRTIGTPSPYLPQNGVLVWSRCGPRQHDHGGTNWPSAICIRGPRRDRTPQCRHTKQCETAAYRKREVGGLKPLEDAQVTLSVA